MLGKKRKYNTGSKRKHSWIYSSRRWLALRAFVLKQSDHRCSECGSLGEVQVHHRIPIAEGGAIWDSENLIALCRSCHLEIHRKIEESKLADWQKAFKRLVEKPITPRSNLRFHLPIGG